MSAPPSNTTIFEGTWDELLQHAPQLAGHRLQVKVLDPALTQPYIPHGVDPSHPPLDMSPQGRAKWFEEFKKWVDSQPPLGPWDDSRDTIYEHP
ncbi:MAG TPA: hypothetical protein VHQ47_04715 [Phycisphaerae bacterium]|nr:hypothetical protein [Phycisphaerae bacterium]